MAQVPFQWTRVEMAMRAVDATIEVVFGGVNGQRDQCFPNYDVLTLLRCFLGAGGTLLLEVVDDFDNAPRGMPPIGPITPLGNPFHRVCSPDRHFDVLYELGVEIKMVARMMGDELGRGGLDVVDRLMAIDLNGALLTIQASLATVRAKWLEEVDYY